ncbi:NADH dehydrogenase subunit 6 (mitochondrion) [Culicoides brevitarsis]|uniref:NADH dehydrogenase subunit 6 n=1 Tax=Culicoides brevitarsis TaxID=469753 RepID=UPI002E786352|nr:NADH dehydrogenase subunit 6 [Culicoides brevitarsis]WPN85967.1 NADH dehydrogenase subunit 6 [Culicoides brevitarsis]
MNFIMMMFLLINSFMFTQLTHPMAMGLILLMQTMLTCLFTGILSKTFWFSYILFLIFIGGLLILFIYMSSLNSNEKFNFSSMFFLKMFILFMMMSFLFMMFNKLFIELFFNHEMMNFFSNINLMKENFLINSKMYELPNNFLMIFLINYLLFNLVIVVKITNFFYGPLRISY